jgi:hypothetical protein
MYQNRQLLSLVAGSAVQVHDVLRRRPIVSARVLEHLTGLTAPTVNAVMKLELKDSVHNPVILLRAALTDSLVVHVPSWIALAATLVPITQMLNG